MNYDDKLELAAKCLPAAIDFWGGNDGSVQSAAEFLGIKVDDYKAVNHWPIVIAKTAFAFAEAMLSESKLRNP